MKEKFYYHKITTFSFIFIVVIAIFISSNSYPNFMSSSAAVPTPISAPMLGKYFDLEAHRGGRGLTTESTLTGFAHAIELGVTTLELDTQVTKDLKVIITHDRQVDPQKCIDTHPAFPHDPVYPYVGKYIRNLTYAEITTLNCGYQQLPGFPRQNLIPHAKMPLLNELFALVKKYHSHVHMNVETKVEAGSPDQTMPLDIFVRAVAAQIEHSGLKKQITVQSFAWGSLKLMHTLEPDLPLYALSNIEFLQSQGPSVWLGGIDPRAYHHDLVAMALTIPGVSAISPVQGNPQEGKISDKNFIPEVTPALIARAHRAHLLVVPWTIDDKDTMAYFLHEGVDGMITDFPDTLREVMQEAHYALPQPITCLQ